MRCTVQEMNLLRSSIEMKEYHVNMYTISLLKTLCNLGMGQFQQCAVVDLSIRTAFGFKERDKPISDSFIAKIYIQEHIEYTTRNNFKDATS